MLRIYGIQEVLSVVIHSGFNTRSLIGTLSSSYQIRKSGLRCPALSLAIILPSRSPCFGHGILARARIVAPATL
jgi:hypothetical protein